MFSDTIILVMIPCHNNQFIVIPKSSMHRKIRYPQPRLTTQHSDLFIGNRDYETKTK